MTEQGKEKSKLISILTLFKFIKIKNLQLITKNFIFISNIVQR